MVVREKETLTTLKERLKKKLQVKDEEFAKVIIISEIRYVLFY